MTRLTLASLLIALLVLACAIGAAGACRRCWARIMLAGLMAATALSAGDTLFP